MQFSVKVTPEVAARVRETAARFRTSLSFVGAVALTEFVGMSIDEDLTGG